MLPATSIKDVISQLKLIIDWALKNNSRIGHFATLCRNMTLAVGKGITDNVFEDGPGMERLDVHFSNRYLSFKDCRAYAISQLCYPPGIKTGACNGK